MEEDLLARRFGIEKGDVFVDVLKKRDRDAELVSQDFDQDDERFCPSWLTMQYYFKTTTYSRYFEIALCL